MVKKIGLLAVLLALTFLVYACTDEVPLVDEDDVLGEPEAPDEDDVVEDDDALEELKSLVMGTAEYMVSYEYDFLGEDMSLTQYVKGNRMRTDSEAFGMVSRVYLLEDSVVTCMEEAGQWMCFESERDEVEGVEAGDDPVIDDLEEGTFDGTIQRLPGRTVAGTSTSCFRALYLGFTYDYCYSAEGVPLLVEAETDEGSWSMTATDYSTSVQESAFELPAEPGSFDDMLGAWGY